MIYFSPEMTKDEAKKIFRRECINLHPDKPGGSQTAFVKMQAQYEAYLRGTLKYSSKAAKDEAGAMADFINANEFIKIMDGVTVELTGTWIWLSGNTFEYKEEIKKHGYRYSRSKKKWYKAPKDTQQKKKRGTDFAKIQAKYGYEAAAITNNTKAIA
jgi:hypothetical protein